MKVIEEDPAVKSDSLVARILMLMAYEPSQQEYMNIYGVCLRTAQRDYKTAKKLKQYYKVLGKTEIGTEKYKKKSDYNLSRFQKLLEKEWTPKEIIEKLKLLEKNNNYFNELSRLEAENAVLRANIDGLDYHWHSVEEIPTNEEGKNFTVNVMNNYNQIVYFSFSENCWIEDGSSCEADEFEAWVYLPIYKK